MAGQVALAAFTDESLDYKVMYKWGLVQKQAGHATLSLRVNGDNYNTSLTAASEKWADRFFKVRDTLTGVVRRADFRPLVYRKMSHEGGERKDDRVIYSYNGETVTGKCTRKAWDKKGALRTDQAQTFTAQGATIDMLSSFYWMRDLPYQKWQTGHTETINLFSGKRKEILTVKYLGKDTVKENKRTYDCYHISFSFTDPANPRTRTSDDMEAWISADNARIPIKLEGKLKVGKVQCFYTGGSK